MSHKTLINFGITLLCSSIIATTALAAENPVRSFSGLEVKPTNSKWFIEYLQPGEQHQQTLQIANFSNHTRQLTLYVSEASTDMQTQFQVQPPEATAKNLATWVELPTETLTVEPQQTKIISVNFKPPANAVPALYPGAIMVREETDSNVTLEQGVRIYLNIIGSVAATTENNTTGTASIPIWLPIIALIVLIVVYSKNINWPFATTQPATWTKIPIIQNSIAIIAIFSLIFGVAIANSFNSTTNNQQNGVLLAGPGEKPPHEGDNPDIGGDGDSGGEDEGPGEKPDLGDGTGSGGSSGSSSTGDNLGGSIFQEGATASVSYQLTVTWGQLRQTINQSNTQKNWQGSISFTNATISTSQLTNFEPNDQTQIMDNKTTLSFNLSTATDNDSITLQVEALENVTPNIRYENTLSGQIYNFPLTNILGSSTIYPDHLHATEFRAQYSDQNQITLEETADENDQTTEEDQNEGQAPSLNNLFIENLPSGGEELSNFILNSNYVQETIIEGTTDQFRTDNILIKTLRTNEDILEEITSTPNRNFMFVPAEIISFPPTNFSFSDNQTTEQNLGTIIVVSNDNQIPWNTYITATDLELLSGTATISASNLTIDPGDALPLQENADPNTTRNNTSIQTGEPHNLSGNGDRANLVTVNRATSNPTFVLNPRLKLTIPKGTPAGTYRGDIIISSL